MNGNPAQKYGDFTFAETNLSLSNGPNTFTIVAQNSNGLTVTNPFTVDLPTTNIFQYDANGNLTNDGTRTFAYDGENQLTNFFVTGRWRTDFLYDGLRRRRITREYGWSSNWVQTNEIRYLYDGMLVIQERDSSNTPQVTYTRGIDFSGSIHGAGGIGGLLARTDGNGSTFYHADGAGDVTALMDGNENIVARYEYDPFGRLIGRWGLLADANRYRFSSKEISPVSGLYYYGFRFYDPTPSRWLNRDPMGEYGGINLFEPVCNSPLNCVDSDGRLAPTPVPAPISAPPGPSIASGLFTGGGEITLGSALGLGIPVAVGGVVAGALISEGIGLDNKIANWMVPDVGSAPLPFPANHPHHHRPQPQPAGPPMKPPCPPKRPTASAPSPGGGGNGGENEYTARGREAHKWWEPPPGYQKEFTFENGLRADAVNFEIRDIIEYKPDNPDAIALGEQKLLEYIEQAQKQFPGSPWTGRVVTY